MLFRSLLYYLLFLLNLLVFCITFLPLFVMPRSIGLKVLSIWAKLSQKLLFYSCKIDFEVIGRDKIPNQKILIASKHQSAWETINFIHILNETPIMIFKKELLFIPLFGLYALKFGNIAINRKVGSYAIKDMVKKAKKTLRNNRPILIFPEGTRQGILSESSYKRGILALYKNLNIPCVPVALNSGKYWPRNTLKKVPGKITVEFLDPIPPGMADDQFMEILKDQIDTASKKLL